MKKLISLFFSILVVLFGLVYYYILDNKDIKCYKKYSMSCKKAYEKGRMDMDDYISQQMYGMTDDEIAQSGLNDVKIVLNDPTASISNGQDEILKKLTFESNLKKVNSLHEIYQRKEKATNQALDNYIGNILGDFLDIKDKQTVDFTRQFLLESEEDFQKNYKENAKYKRAANSLAEYISEDDIEYFKNLGVDVSNPLNMIRASFQNKLNQGLIDEENSKYQAIADYGKNFLDDKTTMEEIQNLGITNIKTRKYGGAFIQSFTPEQITKILNRGGRMGYKFLTEGMKGTKSINSLISEYQDILKILADDSASNFINIFERYLAEQNEMYPEGINTAYALENNAPLGFKFKKGDLELMNELPFRKKAWDRKELANLIKLMEEADKSLR
jgi:hypothetical protein